MSIPAQIKYNFFLLAFFCFIIIIPVSGQFIPAGAGSYTKTFPGKDVAGRNDYPTGTPNITANAIGKPVPTNDWWSSLLKNNFVNNLFNYPLALRTVNEGLVVSYIVPGSGPNGSSQPMDDTKPIIVGVSGLNATKASVSDYSDWTVSMKWENGSYIFNSTVGLAMPFIYFTKNAADIAQIIVNEGTVSINSELLIIQNARNGSDFAVYAPLGSTWTQNGKTYTSDLNGKNYWSMAFIPPSASSISQVADEYKKFAYVFPSNTIISWLYDENTSTVRTVFKVETELKEGSDSTMLIGLLPHQWDHLANDSPVPAGYTFPSIRGEVKTLDGNEFIVENTFYGILPTLPYLCNYSPGFDPSLLNSKVELLENEGLSTWTDSYNEGQVMNRLIQTARIADLTGNITARDKMLETIKERLEDWLTAEAGEVAFLFYYNSNWSVMIGYPAGHGQDGNINDHHFHWGYFIHAASFIEQFEPGWASDWGEMINLLVRDAASQNRNDDLFPYLRSFSPYAGHSWANGFATFPFGNDQESTSESMQFNSSLIHWGTVTGNDSIRDLGIYLYTTEQTAIEEYWLDIHERSFKPGYNFSLASRIWGNGYDNQTFWTSDIAAAYGIEMYPIHGGSLYLGHHHDYVEKLWNEISANTGILTNQANDNLWHDVMWEYLSFIDPQSAITLYNSYPNRSLKFGISDVQTYYWLHSMNALGMVDASVTADYPVAAVFKIAEQQVYVAHNYSDTTIVVNFSDGYSLSVPAGKMATSKDVPLSGTLSSSFPAAFPNGKVELTVEVSGGVPSKVQFYDGSLFLGEDAVAPYVYSATKLKAGKHSFYARIYNEDEFAVSNIVKVIVGRQLPYTGIAAQIPGVIEAGHYDKFEGGNGQGICYNDGSVQNEGGFRATEYVDASNNITEGATVGWIAAGEWLEYTVMVQTPGIYSLSFRYASDNANGGGPFLLELNGKLIAENIKVNSTSGWDKWASKTISNIALPGGEHVLRIVFQNGEFNLGKMTFAYTEPLPYDQPVADAGQNFKVLIPETTASLDGSTSMDPGSNPLSFLWSQVYGPSVIVFSDNTAVKPGISSLEEGVYLVKLMVSNGENSDEDEVYVIVSETSDLPPTVTINSPENNSEFIEGEEVIIGVEASDLDGTIIKVEFFADGLLIGTLFDSPYELSWTAATGEYVITAIATDNDNLPSEPGEILIIFKDPPPCDGIAPNGEYRFVFSADDVNPTLTFVPSIAGVGSPTCILYYNTSGNTPMPGYNVQPNIPFRLSAPLGSIVYFYYTYSYPGQGEHNTSNNITSFKIGNCSYDNTGVFQDIDLFVNFFPNPVKTFLNLQLAEGKNEIRIYDIQGSLLETIISTSTFYQYDMNTYQPGMYFLELLNSDRKKIFKVIKED